MKMITLIAALWVVPAFAQTSKTPTGAGGGSSGTTYVRNGTTTPVSQDTATPANSRALPVSPLNTSGVQVDPATSQKQDTGNASLGSIDTKTPALVGGSVPVTLANQLVSASLAANGDVISSLDVSSFPQVSIQITGNSNGALYYYGSNDNVNFSSIAVAGLAGNGGNSPYTFNGLWVLPVSFKYLKLTQSGWTSGTMSVNVLGKSTASGQDFSNQNVSVQNAPNIGGISGPVALPTGASTAALQTTGNTSLGSIDTKTPALVTGRVPVDGSAVTQPVSASSLPLPTGASTSALQTTMNTSIASIDTKTPSLGQAAMAASTPVVIASNQSALPVASAVPAALTSANAAVTVGTTAVRLVTSGTTPSATRRKLVFMASTGNTGNCYFGGSNLAIANGINAFPGAVTTYDNDANDYYGICDTAAQTFFVMEVK
jgi:hypothetical protein